ncbi:hypothetical protein DM02DRAFT_659634 [Periconia macrospinosa]|uniref:Ubiquitin 3 binding protein But2 C-terminal domain-containing protein n=1 Tax=Periconia macrospinosa TaxID=97972 RepID=A0A2V1DCV6_9PLEO|nr:hypothetical protein DM02DRAFT_659634 [Periconia macrospinosa]
MLCKPLFLFIALGEALSLTSQVPKSRASTRVNGTLTSFTLLEGSGCPAGTYKAQPFEPGKLLNTYVEFDSFVYNSTTSSSPLTCTLSIDFEFVFPESGEAEVVVIASSSVEAKYEEGDDDRTTNFVLQHDQVAVAGSEEISGVVQWAMVKDGVERANVGAGLLPTGNAGDIALGTLRTEFSLFTSFGPGEFAVSQIAIGFGLT